jgi:hypothetical protein
MLTDIQMKNYEFFKKHLGEYLTDPLKKGKHAVIYDLKLQGLFDTFEAACVFAYSTSANDFVVQQIIDESEIVDYLYSAVGLLDTGATQTSIDKKLAAALNLNAIGISDHFTAAGPVSNPVYFADMFFPGAELEPFQNLKIGSCMLPFDLNPPNGNLLSIRNIGILIGRDIMSKWNIVWNGPTSTVFISD